MVTSSQVSKFLLLGFSSFSELQPVLFVLFLCLYLIILCSNLTIFSIICQPLHYLILMTWRVCGQLASTCIVSGFLISLVGTILVFSLHFYGSNKVKHYFCDISLVIQFACAETNVNELVIFICGILVLVVPLIFTCMSYGFIVHTILKIPTNEGKWKAFSTCASHLIVVIVHYGCASSVYVQFSAKYSSSKDRL
ncbi:olfactory receptor 10R2-like [Enhydra lutris kenyoni]|uniref:Olfactory receptor 10R2-like n=1 Tax=Enhydra lutris kenyoni TaxID=391180 RepID=A0A2Y9IJ57_ENHLU|nr:olfactory receptor 10R2-like [Enhydra lutris kenyoni]